MSGPIPISLLSDNAEVDNSGQLMVAGCNILELAEQHGTPLFVYDEEHLRSRCREAYAAFGEGVSYASKAFFCLAMARLVHEESMHIDVSTGGEAFVALTAGVPPEKLILHGNNKSNEELELAINARIGRIVIDSFDEIDRIEALCAAQKPAAPPKAMIRLTPGVQVHTHEYIATGQEDSKFGFSVSTGLAEKAIDRVQKSAHLHLTGLHTHIGSQVFSMDSYRQALRVIFDFASSHEVEEFSTGGGLGVAYIEGESAPTITEWAETIKAASQEAGVKARVSAEPGRAIAAAAAMTLYEVGTIKDLPDIRTYVSVDGGMSDNPRPVLYGSGYETFLPRAANADRPRAIRLVGKHCESGDVLVYEGFVPEDIKVGDVLATPVTGAYGHSMGSNYNKVPRPPVIFAKDGKAEVVVRRETYSDLIASDVGPKTDIAF